MAMYPQLSEKAWDYPSQQLDRENEEAEKQARYCTLVLDPSWRRYLFAPQAQGSPLYWQVAHDLRTEAFHKRELGSRENPAHAFRVAFSDVDQQVLSQILPELVARCEFFCQEHPDLFIGLKPKDNGFCGFMVPNDEFSMHELVYLLTGLQADLRTYLEQVTERNSTHSVAITTLICETPEEGIGIWDIPGSRWQGSSSHLFNDSVGAVGLTTLATALSEMSKSRITGDTLTLVTPSKDEVLYEAWSQWESLQKLGLLGVARVRQDFISELDDPQEVTYHSRKDDVTMYYRSCEPLCERLARDSVFTTKLTEKLALHRRKIAKVDSQLVPEAESMVLAHFFKSGAMFSYDQLNRLNPNWAQDLQSPEGIEKLRLRGNAGVLKIDVSGLTRLANESGEDPGKFVVELLMEYVKPLDEIFGQDDYLISLDGDALTLAVLDSFSTETGIDLKIEKFVQLAQRSGALWVDIVEQVAERHPRLRERTSEIDIKAVACISTHSSDVTAALLPGGRVQVIYPLLDEQIHQAEEYASSGGFTMTLVTDGPPSSGVMNRIGALRLEEENVSRNPDFEAYLYPLETQLSVTEARMKKVMALFSERYPEDAAEFQHIFDQLNDVRLDLIARDSVTRDLATNKLNPFALRSVKNNWITNAKILLAYDVFSQENPQASEVLWGYIQQLSEVGVKANVNKLQKLYTLIQEDEREEKEEDTWSLEQIKTIGVYKRFKDAFAKTHSRTNHEDQRY